MTDKTETVEETDFIGMVVEKKLKEKLQNEAKSSTPKLNLTQLIHKKMKMYDDLAPKVELVSKLIKSGKLRLDNLKPEEADILMSL